MKKPRTLEEWAEINFCDLSFCTGQITTKYVEIEVFHTDPKTGEETFIKSCTFDGLIAIPNHVYSDPPSAVFATAGGRIDAAINQAKMILRDMINVAKECIENTIGNNWKIFDDTN